ncbi:MAG: DUF2892 domain-containing protein [Bacteroidia bacterium]|nr:DUF2892 domain-containing protein [Bacteroidia bacterium]
MRQNLNILDRTTRLFLVAIICMINATGFISGTFAIITLAIGVLLLYTVIFGRCPVYNLLGFRTYKKENYEEYFRQQYFRK